MFDAKQLSQIDPGYFNIITVDDHDVTIQSRNTGHYWYLHGTGYPSAGACVIFHKHQFRHPYHLHGRAGTLRQAVKGIKRHDQWGGEKRINTADHIKKWLLLFAP